MKGLNITLIVITLVLIAQSSIAQNIFYVTTAGTGQGTSWHDSSSDINAVLFAAKPGDMVWVARGTYTPTPDNNRSTAFMMPSDVKMYGGFAGTETELYQRNHTANTTVLSGAIGTPSTADNSYNVVVFKHASAATVLDGFTIQDGTGNGEGTTGDRNRCGGGIYNDGAGRGNSSTPSIANCTFINNSSRDGGAVYNNGISGKANATFTDCVFAGNQADFDGGAIFNDGRKGGQSNSTFINCEISGNSANYGGGVINYAGAGESSPVFQNCLFSNNQAKVRGGGMYNMDVEGVCEPMIKHCAFAQNDASTGASMENLSTVRPSPKREQFALQAPREWSN